MQLNNKNKIIYNIYRFLKQSKYNICCHIIFLCSSDIARGNDK